MKKQLMTYSAIIFLALSLTACTNQDYGTIGGAALGGLAGNAITGGSFGGTVVGAIGGGLIGRAVTSD